MTRLLTIYTDEAFANLFPTHGQPALAPWRLALVTIFQFIEGLTDRQAADAVRDRLAWKGSVDACHLSSDTSINPANGNMYFIGFYNGNLISYNIYSHGAKNMGKPSPGDGWQEGTWDYQRNRYYGVGNGNSATNSGGGKVVVYDTLHQKTIFSGLPIDRASGKTFHWANRARLLDRFQPKPGVEKGERSFL